MWTHRVRGGFESLLHVYHPDEIQTKVAVDAPFQKGRNENDAFFWNGDPLVNDSIRSALSPFRRPIVRLATSQGI